jgi:hypothetical protein
MVDDFTWSFIYKECSSEERFIPKLKQHRCSS